jgi:hypothetical protein
MTTVKTDMNMGAESNLGSTHADHDTPSKWQSLHPSEASVAWHSAPPLATSLWQNPLHTLVPHYSLLKRAVHQSFQGAPQACLRQHHSVQGFHSVESSQQAVEQCILCPQALMLLAPTAHAQMHALQLYDF